MFRLLFSVFRLLVSPSSVNALTFEKLALRQPLAVMKRQCPRPRLRSCDHLFWVWLSGVWPNWQKAVLLVKPKTVRGGPRHGFRLFWTWMSRRNRSGRPGASHEVREWFHRRADAHPLWGAPWIQGELLKRWIEISGRTVSRLIPKHRKPLSQTRKAFLNTYVTALVSMDVFTVPTASFRVLLVWGVLAHHHRRVIHFSVTEHPKALGAT